MRINTNTMAASAQRNLGKSAGSLAKSIERLSSGLRINRAGDDAAGLVISQKLRAETSGLKQSVRNAQDGISFAQTAEGALDEVGVALNRMRDLVVQARNGTQDSDSVAAIQAEYNALHAEISRINDSTEFAGKAVFNQAGGTTAIAFQVGNGDSDQISISIGDYDATELDVVETVTDAGVLAKLDGAISTISTARGGLGAAQNRLESTVRNLSVTAENLAASESRIRDVDVAEEMISFTKSQILQQAGTAMLAQANAVPQSALQLLG